MNREETKRIVQIMYASYPNYHPENISQVVDAWTVMMSDLNYKDVEKGLMAYIRNDTSGFAPSIGQIISMIQTIDNPHEFEVTPLEAWDMVYKALSDSSYHAAERFNELPALVQKAVGTPSQLKSWAMDEDFNMGVAQSQFIKVYNNVLEREKQIAKMPVHIRPDSALEQKQQVAIEDKSFEKVVHEGTEPPRDLWERMNKITSEY